MSVTSQQLSKSGAKGKDLDVAVREQLLIIDDHLSRADRTWGRNILAHELPTNLSFPGLEKKDAQRIIYSAIIRSLQERGFGVRLLLETDRTVLYAEWVTDLNTEEIAAMNRLISSVCIDSGEVEEFLAREGEAPAPAEPADPNDGVPPQTTQFQVNA